MMRCLDVSFHMRTRKNPGGWRTSIGEKKAIGPTAMEELSDLVCSTSRCAVSESIGQHAVSLWTGSARFLGVT